MKKLSQLLRTNAEGGDVNSAWYFLILAFLAVPFEKKGNTRQRGTLFRQYYLIKARNVESAYKKAERILDVSEHLEGGGRLNGKRVAFRKVGILNLEPLYHPIASGAELFDESETDVAYTTIKKKTLSAREKRRMIKYEREHGKPSLLPVYWGDDFDRL